MRVDARRLSAYSAQSNVEAYMSDVEVQDRRRVRQEQLGPAAKVQTTTLKPKEDGEKIAPKSKEITEAQQAVQDAKARDGAPPPAKKAKAPPPMWSADNKAVASRATEAVAPPTSKVTDPFDGAVLAECGDLTCRIWCSSCGRIIWQLKDGRTVCKLGHASDQPLTWEEAAVMFDRQGATSKEAAEKMATDEQDVIDYWRELRAQAPAEPVKAESATIATAIKSPTPRQQVVDASAEVISASVQNEVELLRIRLHHAERRLEQVQEALLALALRGYLEPAEVRSLLAPLD
jgi:hypothetical protein